MSNQCNTLAVRLESVSTVETSVVVYGNREYHVDIVLEDDAVRRPVEQLVGDAFEVVTASEGVDIRFRDRYQTSVARVN